MRKLTFAEGKKRGCVYCRDVKKAAENRRQYLYCPHSECPYTELDNYNTYSDYLKATYGRPGLGYIVEKLKNTLCQSDADD